MRSGVRVTIAGLVALWFLGTASTIVDPREPSAGQERLEARAAALDFSGLERRWRMLVEASDDPAVGGKHLESMQIATLQVELRDLGWEESEALARAALLRARTRESVADARLAVDFGPSLPAAHLALAEMRFREAPANLGGWLPSLKQALRSVWQREGERRLLIAHFGILLLLSLGIAGALALAWGLGRRLPTILHDLSHLSGRTLARWQVLVLGGAAGLAIAGSGLGIALLALLLLGVAWLYMPSSQRSVLAAWVVLLALSPFALTWLVGYGSWAVSPAAVLEGMEHRGDFVRFPELVALAEEEALAEAFFVLARLHQAEGHTEKAREFYEGALERRPGWPEAALNLANLYLAEGEAEEAESLYLAAIEQKPDLAEAHFNLSKLYYRSGKLLAAQANRRDALELRPALAGAYGQEEEREGSLRLLDVSLPMKAIAPLGFVSPPEGFTDEVATALWAPLDSHSAPIAVLLALLLFEFSLFGRGWFAPSPACKSCGAPLCVRCHPLAGDEGEICGPCGRLEGRKGALDPLARQRQQGRVERHQTLRKALVRGASFLGMGSLAAGRAWEGVVWLALLLFLGGAAAGLGFLPPAVEPWPSGLRLTLLALPLGLVYVAAVVRGWRHGG